ncbi:hypothetical protein Dester_1434 [Desulfurobacterium thermolithotrophum DSM 11699]|uniref:Lipoprotein n=1 Tax=Desulfurobacterium thermolithotrophum (strain DSM 11699 / BSA) TaxID=868864 RepID=F0S1Y3_DESTD|nr:hypothetical protein [Desulfurobacterium thermolithotrophum]ADY74064.1 hypothetical protein Dester_1434 [Desulfurobacterium thermolithotrophum DSM 11699]
MKKLLFLPLILLLTGGCAVNSISEKETVTTNLQQTEKNKTFDDVAIYPGFKADPAKSFIYESGDIKVGRLVLRGRAPITEVVNFYKNTLPKGGWEPVSISIYGKEANLTYMNQTRVLQIQVIEGFSETTLIIQIGPKGELTTPTE